ncbi:MAG: LysR family transcriptional regulator [Pseudomonadota bacterium]
MQSFDLNLLIVFDTMMTERSVTKAGERMGLAQSSMSNALARLRVLFEDELFVRTPDGMVPTAKANEAAEYVKAALAAAESAVTVGASFHPQTASAEITLLTNDFIELAFLPKIIRELDRQAPGVRLFTRGAVRDEFASVLDAGAADVAIGAASEVPKRFGSQTLFVEPFVCIARRGHPVVSTELTLEGFLSCRHALISHRPDGRGVVDDALDRIDRKRSVVASVAGFASLPHLIAETDLIAVLPRRLALKAQDVLPLNLFELPFHVPTVEAKLVWGRGVDRAPLFTWFRQVVVDCVAEDPT